MRAISFSRTAVYLLMAMLLLSQLLSVKISSAQSLPPGSNLRTSVINVQTDSNFSASYDGYKAKDGVVSQASKWTSTNTSSTHWISYDLGALRNVTGYVVRHAGAANEATYFNTAAFLFQSSGSMSGPWTDETSTIYNSANVSSYIYPSARQLRYVRLLITDAGIDDYARIPEFEVYGSNITTPPNPAGSNLATMSGVVPWADTEYNGIQTANRARDAIVSVESKWTSTNASSTHWLAYDLGALKNVTGYVVKHAGAANEPTYYNTAAFLFQSSSSANGPWVNETSTIYNSANVSVYTYPSARQLRYVRLLVTDAGIDDYARIPEFEVWGYNMTTPTPTPTPTPPPPTSSFVTTNGGSLWYKGSPYRFVGGNIRELIYILGGSAEQDQQIEALRNMNAKVVRVYLANKDRSTAQAVAEFKALINKVAPDNDLKFLVALTDFIGGRFNVPGDDAAYEGGYLRPAWFQPAGAAPNFRTNYKGFVQAVVTDPQLNSDPRILGWELGNELMAGNTADMVTFIREMACAIQGWDTNHLVSTGFVSSWHATKGSVNQVAALHQVTCSTGQRAIDFGSIHGYNNMWSNPPCNGCTGAPYNYVYHHQDEDFTWFAANNFPYVVGELGFQGAFATAGQCWNAPAFPGGAWGSTWLPEASGDRGPVVSATINKFFDQLSADGVLQWGFMAGPDTNDSGDFCYGMNDTGPNIAWGFRDWNSLFNVYRNKALSL